MRAYTTVRVQVGKPVYRLRGDAERHAQRRRRYRVIHTIPDATDLSLVIPRRLDRWSQLRR